jgi:hypothetical protein
MVPVGPPRLNRIILLPAARIIGATMVRNLDPVRTAHDAAQSGRSKLFIASAARRNRDPTCCARNPLQASSATDCETGARPPGANGSQLTALDQNGYAWIKDRARSDTIHA